MKMALKFTKGALVWVKHPTEAWVPATVSEVMSENKLRVFYGDGGSNVVKIQADHPILRTISCPGDIELSSGMSDIEDLFSDDLTEMTQLVTPAVLYTLHKEYDKGRFYSKLGSGTILALNPFREVPDLFTVKAIQTYHSVPLSELQNLPAHVYAAAQGALVRLRASVGKVNQSIIVSGESGAGKTWTVRCLMRYLAEVGIEQRHRLSSTEREQSFSKSTYSTPKTSRNHFSHDMYKSSPVRSRQGMRNGISENGKGLNIEENDNFNNNTCPEKILSFPDDMAAGDNVSVSSYKTAENSLGDSYEDPDETLNINESCGSVFPPLDMSLDSNNFGKFDSDDSDVDLNVSLEIVDRIERRILYSNPILEAFGNACTLRNDNSSRFGKYIQLQYDRSGTIVGAQLRTYLLEKTRAVRHDAGERSYHIFYQMINGANKEQRNSWRLPDIAFPQESDHEKHSAKEQFRYSSDFEETRSSMLRIGIDYKMQDNIFKLLSSLLYLRSLSFEGTDDLITPCTLDSSNVNNENNLWIASELLGVYQHMIMEAITFREITAHSNRRKSVFHRPSTVEECKSRRNSLVKFVYDILFHWIVDRVGESVSAPAGNWCNFIGLLDVYGFESFDHNSLEQLCINYANEKLQQHFVASFLREQQEEYLLEGVSWQHCDLTDNVECLTLLELPRNSLFSLLNEECRLNRANASSGLKSRVESMFNGCKFIVQPRISTAEPSFTVVHYAGHVNYQTRDLIEKNKDEVPPEIIQLLASSRKEYVHDLLSRSRNLPESEDTSTQEDISPNKAKQKQTVLTRFKESLDDLLETLASTDCHYIRCIKPNKQSQPGVFDSKFVLDQLRACGVVETVRICSPAHPNKMSYSEFTARYRFLLRKDAILNPQEKSETTPSRKKRRCLTNIDMRKEACFRIVRILYEQDKNIPVVQKTKEPLQFGKTKVFLSAQLFELLESARSQEIDKCTVTIQQSWRQFAHRRRCREERKRVIVERERGTVLLQRAWRNILAVRECRIKRRAIIEKRQESATKLQNCWRLYKRRQNARKEREMIVAKQNIAAITIQAGFRGWRVRCKYRDLMEAWTKLKLIPEEEYRKMIQRQLRNLLPPCVISMPSPSYEAIKSTFEIPKIGKTSTPKDKRRSEQDSGVHTLPSTSKSFYRSPDEKFSVYYDSKVSKSTVSRESVIHDDLDPDEEFDLQTFGKLNISTKWSPKVLSPDGKDSDSDVEPPLRSSGGIRHAKIVRSSSNLHRLKVAGSKVKEIERSRSMPRLLRGPGVIYAWHNRAAISMMTPKRPLSLSSDPLTLLEMQYNRSSSVLTTPLPGLRLLNKRSRNHQRRSRHHQSPQNLSYSDKNLSSSSFNRFSPSRSAVNTWSHSQYRRISRSGSNCILKHADVKPKFT